MSYKPRRVLVVEDEQETAFFICDVLVGEGFTVDVAFNGIDALQKLQKRAYDLITLDVVLPQVNGVDVYETMFADPSIRPAPVIIVSSLSKDSDESAKVQQKLEELSVAYDQIQKPFEPEELVAKARNLLTEEQVT